MDERKVNEHNIVSNKIDKLEYENQTVFFKSAEDMSEIEDESITLVVTSPPYWNVRDYGGKQIGRGQSYSQYINSLNNVWKECLRVLIPNGKICINVQPLPIPSDKSGFNFRVIYDIMHDIERFFLNNDCFLSGMIFWDKSAYINNVAWGSYPRPTNISTNTSFEQIYTFVKRGKTRKIDKEIMMRNLLDKKEWIHWAVHCIWDDINPVIKINSKGENHFGHSAPFPEDIPYRLIRMHTVEGEKVLDPFLGSGTTLKVARLTGRIGIGYEINEKYKNVILSRIEEDWKPPEIEDGYIKIGLNSLSELIMRACSYDNKGINMGYKFGNRRKFSRDELDKHLVSVERKDIEENRSKEKRKKEKTIEYTGIEEETIENKRIEDKVVDLLEYMKKKNLITPHIKKKLQKIIFEKE